MRIEHNKDVREYAKRHGVYLYELAESVGLSDGNFTRRLRRELTSSEKDTLFRNVDRIAEYKDLRRAEWQEEERERKAIRQEMEAQQNDTESNSAD